MERLSWTITWNFKAPPMDEIGVSVELLRKKAFLYIDADLLPPVVAIHL
jgi:hypothetical protein